MHRDAISIKYLILKCIVCHIPAVFEECISIMVIGKLNWVIMLCSSTVQSLSGYLKKPPLSHIYSYSQTIVTQLNELNRFLIFYMLFMILIFLSLHLFGC